MVIHDDDSSEMCVSLLSSGLLDTCDGQHVTMGNHSSKLVEVQPRTWTRLADLKPGLSLTLTCMRLLVIQDNDDRSLLDNFLTLGQATTYQTSVIIKLQLRTNKPQQTCNCVLSQFGFHHCKVINFEFSFASFIWSCC